ncbi:MAG: undecaprenyl-phosphate glucose phosphotransferase [marine bacterium B5-7]|nr:MAG: undecaprenyl-phosphate glucose phosphotransferase [marine bacterium B5-7]
MMQHSIFKYYMRWFLLGTIFLDVSIIAISAVLAYYGCFKAFLLPVEYQKAVTVLSLAFFFSLISRPQIYAIRTNGAFSHVKRICLSVSMLFLSFILLLFLFKLSHHYSRAWILSWFMLGILLLLIVHGMLILVLHYTRLRGLNAKTIVIIGAGDLGRKIADRLLSQRWLGFHVLEFWDDMPSKQVDSFNNALITALPADVESYIKEHQIEEVWLALPITASARVSEILEQLKHSTVAIRYVPDVFKFQVVNFTMTELVGLPIINLQTTPMTGFNRLIKGLEDRALALFFLLVTSPLFLFIPLIIKLSSRGPVFYRQRRVSFNGEEFDMLKFRSMQVGAENKTGAVWAKKADNRTTWIGGILRKTSLDEIPQFLNVLKGDMSIVGPRPERPVFIEQFKHEVPKYMQKHLVKAGITGWAQVNGWRGNTSLEKRIEHDIYYIENWSLWFDIKIIFLTVLKGLVNKNAY